MPTLFAALSTIPNACQALPNVVTGGQPGAMHFEAAKAAGCEVVLDLRDPMEPRPLDEPATVRTLGMEYINVPVTPDTLTDETLDRIREILRRNDGRPMLCHCGSGSRVGGAMIAHLMLDQDFAQEDAVNQAMRLGLRNPELIDWAIGYVVRVRRA
ncbi:MAG: fused DSP-PTPase phosphatase/NAD kinase-like protein [Gemmatimonadota bacterium]